MFRAREIFQRYNLSEDPHILIVYEPRLFLFYLFIRKRFPFIFQLTLHENNSTDLSILIHQNWMQL